MRFFKFTQEDVVDSFSGEIYQLGQELHEKNRILEYDSLAISRKEIKILSMVEGFDDVSYEQETIIYLKNDKIDVEGICTCSLGANCEHVVAVTLQHISDKDGSSSLDNAQVSTEEMENDPKDDVKKWLNLLFEISKQEEKREKGDIFLAYKIVRNSNQYTDDIKCYKTRIIKNGALGKGTLLDINSLAYNDYNYDFLDSGDIDILKIMNAISPRHQDTFKLKDKIGNDLLKAIIATDRCYLEDADQAITISNDRVDINFSWSNDDSLNRSLVSNMKNDEFIIATKPILFVKSLSNHIYELSSRYNLKTLKTLLSSPAIPNDFFDEVVSQIDRELPMIEIEPPSHYEIRDITNSPKVSINITTAQIDNIIEHIIIMKFIYEDNIVEYIPRNETKKLIKDGYCINIIRDFTLEDKYISELNSLGFVNFIDDDRLIFKSPDEQSLLSIDRWRLFLESDVNRLKLAGWKIEFDNSFNMEFNDADKILASVERGGENSWFGLSFDIEIGGQRIPILSIVSSLIYEFSDITNLPEFINIEISKNSYVKLKSSDIEPILKTIFNLYENIKEKDTIEIEPYNIHLIESFENNNIEWIGSKEIIELSKKIKDFDGIEKVDIPKNLNADLREYQEDGISWLNFLYEYNFSGILADDMGLGKTLQMLAHLQNLKEREVLTKPSLIIMPTSLIGNWKSEANKFTPNLKILSLYGSNRFELLKDIKNYDIILTTYQLASKDEEILQEEDFLYIILDEAQKIKNPRTKMARSIKSFNSDYRVALSGTPIENHLGELWSIFSFLMPGFLSSLTLFKRYYQNPIEKDNNFERQHILNHKIKPFMLRRTKDNVIDELPDKTEIIKYVQFNPAQIKLYESIRVAMEKEVRDMIIKKGIASSHITILDALLRLRQVCCDPSLLRNRQDEEAIESAKLELFLELVEELLEEGRKILVFSQFTSMLKIIEDQLIKRGVKYSKLIGSTKNRDAVIDEFRNGESDIFLISLKAGGVGLNLVEADTVIHYDPWWNPAVENQATDRAYRIGQTKAVFVYKLIVQNSIEEKIIELQKRKKGLQDNLYSVSKDEKLNSKELLDLLKG